MVYTYGTVRYEQGLKMEQERDDGGVESACSTSGGLFKRRAQREPPSRAGFFALLKSVVLLSVEQPEVSFVKREQRVGGVARLGASTLRPTRQMKPQSGHTTAGVVSNEAATMKIIKKGGGGE